MLRLTKPWVCSEWNVLREAQNSHCRRHQGCKVLCVFSEVLCGICSFSDIKYRSELCGECQALLDGSLAVSTPAECWDVSVSSEKHTPITGINLFLPFTCHFSLIYGTALIPRAAGCDVTGWCLLFIENSWSTAEPEHTEVPTDLLQNGVKKRKLIQIKSCHFGAKHFP